jgi:hypothetical protein
MNSQVESKTSYSLAVIAVGTALVVLFAGACVIIAVHREVPQELWAAASVLSGALVGILIPTPSGGGADQVATAAGFTQRTATSAAHAQAKAINKDDNRPLACKQAANTAVTAVKEVRVAATVKKVRDANTPVSEVIDSVVGAFAALAHDTGSKILEAQDNVAAAQGKRNDAQREHEAAQTKLQAAQEPAEAGQQQQQDAEALQAKVAQAEAAVSQAHTTLQQAGVTLERAEATQEVHAAAAHAAAKVRATAATIADAGSGTPGSAAQSIGKQTLVLLLLVGFVLLAVLVVALWLAMEIAQGNIHPAKCLLASGGKTQECDSNLQQIGTVLLSLASAAGGTLLGLFATPDGKPSSASATSTASK